MCLDRLGSTIRYLFIALALFLSGCSAVHNQSASGPRNKPLVTIEQGQLEYYELGEGSPVVLITGFGMDLSSWNHRFLTALSQQHRVIVFNNRGVGQSFVRSSRYDTKALAKDTHQLIVNLHLRNPAVVGISMGGMIAQQLAVLYPQQLGQLILINSVIAGQQAVTPDVPTEKLIWEMPTSKVGQYIFALNLFFPPKERWSMGVSLIKDRFVPSGYRIADVSAVMPYQRFLVKNWLQDNKAASKLSKLTLPVLVLNGTSDAVIPPINSTILTKTIPHAKLERWKDGGHAMIYQYPEELAQSINRFIQASG